MPQCNAECACCYEIRPSVGQDGRGAASSERDGRRVVEGRMPGTRSGLTFGMISPCALLISTSAAAAAETALATAHRRAANRRRHLSARTSSSASPSPGWMPPDYGTAKPAVDART
jgi:hypothetical protein